MKKLSFTFLILLIFLLPGTALADFGPKSSLDIYVKNAPDEFYYLDLLTVGEYGMDGEYKPNALNEYMYRLLWDYEGDGFKATMTHQGSWLGGIRGGLTGTFSNGYGLHKLSQVPSVFKIIIVTSDGKIHVSQIYRRMKFSDTIYLDYKTMEISSEGESVLVDWLLQFLKTFTATIIIEGIIMLLFGFRLKYNWKPFIIVNLCTQVFLIGSMAFVMIFLGEFAYLLLFGLTEVLIIIIESFVYKKLLRHEKKNRIVLYAVTANIFSLLFSFIIILIGWF